MATDHEISGTSAAHAELLPYVDESPAEYLARLKALHARVGALIGAIEAKRPALGAPMVRPPRSTLDRRAPAEAAERRDGLDDRRIGLPENRGLPLERRDGPRDRRTPLRVDRREDHIERRREPENVPWQRTGFRLDTTAMMWALQIAAWVAVAAIALVYGIGR
jgi:hypothetical protein